MIFIEKKWNYYKPNVRIEKKFRSVQNYFRAKEKETTSSLTKNSIKLVLK